MFFSAREFQQYYNRELPNSGGALLQQHVPALYNNRRYGRRNDPLTLKEAGAILRVIKGKIVRRNPHDTPGKWYRPWFVVPALRAFRPPAGDYGVGVEIEYGFNSQSDASFIVNVIKDWRYVAIDWEGGTWGIETTFAPILYSKLNSKSQCYRYLKILHENQNRLVHHDSNHSIGTHINVSVSGGWSRYRIADVNGVLRGLGHEAHMKYFNRQPYDYGYDQGTHIEWKLFNSQTDWKVLRRYIDIAVALTAFVADINQPINRESVIAALETAYNKHA